MENMPVNLKTKYKPFATFWEYLCPTNNTTYMAYIPGTNPFNSYDFRADIPNPVTRKHAVTDPVYKTVYPASTFKKKARNKK